MDNDAPQSAAIVVTPRRSGTPEEKRAYWREQRKRWRDANPEHARASRNQWRLNNIDKAREQTRAGNKRYLAKPEKREAMRQWHRENGKKNRVALREYQKSWVEKNRDKARAYVSAYDQEHREERKIAARTRRRENRVHVLLTEARWREKNTAYLKKKETKRKAAPGVYDTDKVLARIKLFGDACAYCGGPFEHLDHAIAIARGGTNWPANFRPACRACNLGKGARDWREWKVQF